MTAPDGSAAEALDAFDPDLPQSALSQSTVLAFPGAFSAGAPLLSPANTSPADASPAHASPEKVGAALPDELATALEELARERRVCVEALLGAARLLCGDDGAEADILAAETALAAAGRGPRRMVSRADAERRETRIETLEYRNKALAGALERVSFQPLDGGVREVRDAAQIFGFANEWCFDEDRITRRFRELAPVYHPDTGVVADRDRMAQLIEARNLLIRHVRTAYASGGWVGKRRG